jgi:hypothetical protein
VLTITFVIAASAPTGTNASTANSLIAAVQTRVQVT